MITGFDKADKVRDLVYVILWVLSCSASSFGMLALFRGKLRKRLPWMDSISRCAYLMYALHYVFVIWIQFMLLNVLVDASLKFSITFLITLLATWGSSLLLLQIPVIRAIA
jgi:glucans biosynthesis protein C